MRDEIAQRVTGSSDPATEYAKAVVEGEVVAGPHVRDACARHLRDLEHGPERGLVWDVAAADRFFRFCETVLRLSEGQFDGEPFVLHPSQKFVTGSLFGWKWARSGKRRFRRAYVEQGKGNGKSPMVGAIGLYGMVADGDPSCWEKANPLLGVTITEEYLDLQVKQARDIPAKANGIKRLHFCQWTGAETAWIARKAWDEIEDPTLDLSQFDGQPAYVGLDLSAKIDLTAKAFVFDDGVTEGGEPKFAAFVHGYTPADTMLARAERDQAPYDRWAEDDYITALPGKKIRLDLVAKDLLDDQERFGIILAAYDQYLIADFKDDIDALGGDVPMADHPQNFIRRTDQPCATW